MYKLDEFKQLVEDFGAVADFLVIYIAEAHSTGERQVLTHNLLTAVKFTGGDIVSKIYLGGQPPFVCYV